MESNSITKNQDQLTEVTNEATENGAKKVYTPPSLIVHGKLSELTNGGATKSNEKAAMFS